MELKTKIEKILKNRNIEDLTRKEFTELYYTIGDSMYENCYIPNVYDFACASENDYAVIKEITEFTGNTDSTIESINKTDALYTEEQSSDFMQDVISANVTSITQSGYMYKKLAASTDSLIIDDEEDCGSTGELVEFPISEDLYNYMIKDRFINELDDVTNNFDEFISRTKDLTEIHVRTFLTCNHSHNHKSFCKKCAGVYRRNIDETFIPHNIGIYSTLAITEHATQSALDSMNKGSENVSIVTLLEYRFDREKMPYEAIKSNITNILDQLNDGAVERRFYEIALLSRVYEDNGLYYFVPLKTSLSYQEDKFADFIYSAGFNSLIKMIRAEEFEANSAKTRIAFDIYDNDV